MSAGAPFDIRPRVVEYLKAGLNVVPVQKQSKRILVKDWESVAFDLAAFSPSNNVGIRLGHDGLADVDLDCPEARLIAPSFLPETGWVFGRQTARASHYFYRLDPAIPFVKLMDPMGGAKATLIELRCLTKEGGIGLQSVAPGSVHQDTGELIDFELGANRVIANADADEIKRAVHRIGAAALIARHFPAEGSGRHDTFLCLAGILSRNGWAIDEVLQFNFAIYRAIWGASADRDLCSTEVRDTFARLNDGRNTYGVPTLKGLLPPKVVDAALKWLGIGAAALPSVEAEHQPAGATPQSLNLHDTGNADRLVAAYGDILLFCEARASFGVWTGAHWKLDKGLTVARIAEQVIRDEFAEAGKITNADVRKVFIAHLNASLSRSGIQNMVEVSKRKVRIVAPAEFDDDPYLLNFENGTLDLRSGSLKDHDPNDLITRCIPYAFDAAAECPTFLRFLHRIMGYREGAPAERNESALRLIAYLRRLFGCSLTGKPEKLVAIFHGAGNNGKSTLLETIRAALGGDDQYAGQIQIESLMMKPNEAAASNAVNADLADLQGCRFVTASEPEKGMRFSAARVKYLTGLQQVKARYLRENFFTFQPSHKLFIDANDRPTVSDPNDAIWNRLKLIPFNVQILPHEIDTTLGEKLLRELPGIMAWLAVGAVEYLAAGIEDIPEVIAATEEYRQESDRLRDFISDRCAVGVGWVPVADLWAAYLDWEKENGVIVPLKKTDFDQRIQRHGCKQAKKERGRVRAWDGISLLAPAAEDFPFE